MSSSLKGALRKLGGLTIVLILVGCQSDNDLHTEYGHSSSRQGISSINGTSVFAEMLRGQGKSVRRTTVISPLLKRYDTIVWFPDSQNAPSEKEVDGLETWLQGKRGRTLVYVGRSYDSLFDYLIAIEDQVPLDQREEYQRVVAEARMEKIYAEMGNAGFGVFNVLMGEGREECDWFTLQSKTSERVTQLDGPWAAADVDLVAASLRINQLIEVKENADRKSTPLLKANGKPIASSIKIQTEGSSNFSGSSRLIVINDGSYLLNFALVNQERRKLADQLIKELSASDQVVFLESGPGGATVRERAEPHRPWNWIARPPLRYVVPHLMFWGLLFCFVMYPIFGPTRSFYRRLRSSSTANPESSEMVTLHGGDAMTSFRSHLVAMGKLYQRTEDPDEAAEKIKTFQQSHSIDSTL